MRVDYPDPDPGQREYAVALFSMTIFPRVALAILYRTRRMAEKYPKLVSSAFSNLMKCCSPVAIYDPVAK